MTTTNQMTDTEAGSPTGEPASGVCTKCGAPRDRKNSRYCKADRDAMAADYRARARPRPTYEERTCSFAGCQVVFTWCSMRPKQTCCSKAHYNKQRYWDSRPVGEVVPEGLKRCSKCKNLLALDQFPPSTRTKTGGHCRECARAYEKDWNARNAERNSASTRRSRAARLLRKYQAPHDDVDLLLEQQGGVCYLCDGPAGAKGFQIDHDHELHETGLPSYRGLACHGCNMAIGGLGDDPDRMVLVATRLAVAKRQLRR